MQAHELLKQLRIPELSEVRDYFRSLSTNILLGMGVFTAVTAYWVATRPKALKAPCDLRMQSVELPGGEFARRGAVLNGGPLLSHFYEDAKTMYECFHRGLRESKNGPCLGSRKPKQPYEWLSYSEVIERAENLGSAFLHKGHSKDGDPYIGIFSQNRPEWTISELACYTYSLISVPLYDTLGTEAISYILDKTGISTVVCDVPEKAKLLLDCVSGRQHSVKTLILMENFDTDLVSRAQQCGIDIISLRDAENIGKAHRQHPVPPQPDDLAIICFTSGTTGNPKGAMLTHRNIASNVSAFIYVTKIYGQAHSPLKRHILEFAFRRKENEMKSGIMRRDSVWDKIIFKKVQASVGGHVRLMITGAAPVSAPVLTFLRAALGCHFYEGYGQTECTAGSTTTLPGDWTAGHVGAPLPCNDIKLVDVGEMNYYATKGEGEVCVRGPNVFKGYLKDPEKTKEALGEDGWVHTGDIGRWLPNGTLKIVDRKKHIFKLAQGEYIAPEKIENIYIRSEAVAQAFVHGDSLQACLVAIIVPDPDFLPGWAKKRGIEGSYEELCKNKEVKKAILEDIVKLGKESGLKSFEQVKDIALHTEMFSIQNGLLTPTLKAKRADLRNCFRNLIDELYSNTQM
ncbi:long-chain-fatty-acid--CoA ligase 1-like [Sinocyclocheilus anshuiensis]|uniref:long-chain-fatty-acid--CoA ligase 1-like n=1 Tax=Sinocyclocheilus anshuiensis TaxID=1608454 RepID=UPI0007B7A0FB|nr:PREDICTED: long-chain-fatty-acid--CoA ligase 1-like [Sinocyclocheilus anshuiensis]